MARLLPPNPSLRFLKEEAKDLLRAHGRGDPTCCGTLRLLRRFSKAADADVLAAQVALNEAQFALAIEYGFRGWDDLVHHVQAAQESAVFKDPRAAGVAIRADNNREDTFSHAVTAALQLLGRAADYEAIFALSSNPFAPDLRPDEPARGQWQLQGRERCLDLIAAAYGLAVRPFPDAHALADIPPMPKGRDAEEAWLRENYAKPAASYLSHSLQAGEVVVSCGEWANERGVLWCDWGLVTEARQDGTILGASCNGRSDNRITHVRDGWILRRSDVSALPREDARPRLLRRIVQRIRGEDPPFGPGSRGIIFGLAAMDVWIAAMQQVPYDQEQWQGVDHSAGHAQATALPTFEGSRFAGRHLRTLAADLPVAAGDLQVAAAQYDRIVELLSPAVAGAGPGSYTAFIGDAADQRAHVEQVLVPIRECLASIARSIERALAAG